MFSRQHILWYLSLVLAVLVNFSESLHFVQCPLMNLDKVGNAITAYWTGVTRSMLACYAVCNQDVTCLTASFSNLDRTCSLYNVSPKEYDVNSSRVAIPFGVHFKKLKQEYNIGSVPCQNGAEKHNETHCECINGYVGQFCDKIMQDCTEGFESGFYNGIDGVFVIQPAIAIQPFQVRCIMQDGGYTVIQKNSIDDNLNFNRTWQEFEEGFGNLLRSHWLGLDKMYRVTVGRLQRAHIFVKILSSADYFVQEYYAFTVQDITTTYKMNYDYSYPVDGFPKLGNSFLFQKGQKFTTFDRDNDKSPSNCAVRYGAGFWYDNCGKCSPNGYIDGTYDGDITRAHWIADLEMEVITSIEIRLLKLDY